MYGKILCKPQNMKNLCRCVFKGIEAICDHHHHRKGQGTKHVAQNTIVATDMTIEDDSHAKEVQIFWVGQ